MTVRKHRRTTKIGRRALIRGAAAGSLIAAAAPHIWIPRGIAQTAARDTVKHILYIRLSGGFRFPVAFNAGVGDQFNPFGRATGLPSGTDWGVGQLLMRAPYLEGDQGQALRDMGMRPVHELANRITVVPCVDHEPDAPGADGNHGTGLERYYTGYADGGVGFFTMINYGLREKVAQAAAEERLLLPAFVLGGAGMGRGVGPYAAHRPPVLSGSGFDAFGLQDDGFPTWAEAMVRHVDERYRDRQHPAVRSPVQVYMETRKATEAYSEIFNSETLKVANGSNEAVDGISNAELETLIGDSRAGRDIRLALRLFHFGSPAVYLDQGGYDMHSNEEDNLPGQFDDLNRLISGLFVALDRMQHPSGGTYWDNTLVAFGSEFSRTARGSRFNSARGSDHNSDRSTRWMSMPFFGGAIGRPGARIGETRSGDLEAMGRVFSYRSVMKTMLDALGADHTEFFPADPPFNELFV
ncbi:MAG: DUF1501 domain-containing protein [Myxococcales bacterium]|nr:DUF1501 domain-containing protein [Myxococcales bacterium]MDD9970954.1 DUF1501 domain-containing protein [Myxococcales bacterium]